MVKALVTGSATMAEEMDEHLTILREMVTSPGGTTIAGLNALDKHGFRFALNQAVMASAERSKELGAG
jgi:pyrroline-5-carboxylate reductase